MIMIALLVGIALQITAAASVPPPASTWSTFPAQRCSEPLRGLPRCKSAAACRSACEAVPAGGCGGYDSDGRLYSNACAGSRVGGKTDLFVRQTQQQARSRDPVAAAHPKIDHFIVLYME